MHHTLEQWADFARNVVSAEVAARMQQHLDRGCERCGQALTSMKSVAELGAREAGYEPPVNTVRMSKLLLGAERPEADDDSAQLSRPRRNVRVPRGRTRPPRRLPYFAERRRRRQLHRKGDCCIDIRLEHALGAKEVSLIGQVLDSGQAGRGVGSILVELMSGEKNIAGTATNNFGEFQFLFPVAHQLQICFGISSQNCFWIKIPPLETIPESGLVVND